MGSYRQEANSTTLWRYLPDIKRVPNSLYVGFLETFCKEFSEYKINKVIYEKQPITIYEART